MNTKNLIRWTGLAAMAAGIVFAGIQPIHPPDVLSSVTTPAWAFIQALKLIMCLLFLLGIAGLYARQANEAGWLGLVGFLLFSLSWALTMAFVFAGAFILPVLAAEAPRFVESFLGMVSGSPGEMSLGALSAVWTLSGVLYMLGSLLFGIAMFRARILPRWAAGLLAFSGPLAIIMVALLPHQLERLAAMPMGFALAWLGYALWSEPLEQAANSVPGKGIPQLRHTGAEQGRW